MSQTKTVRAAPDNPASTTTQAQAATTTPTTTLATQHSTNTATIHHMMQPVALTTKALAEQLGVTETTLKDWRAHGTGPDYHIVGRRVIYRALAVDDWLASQPMRHRSHGVTPRSAYSVAS